MQPKTTFTDLLNGVLYQRQRFRSRALVAKINRFYPHIYLQQHLEYMYLIVELLVYAIH